MQLKRLLLWYREGSLSPRKRGSWPKGARMSLFYLETKSGLKGGGDLGGRYEMQRASLPPLQEHSWKVCELATFTWNLEELIP